MTNLNAAAEANYLTRLALQANPFSRQDLQGAFFAGSRISQRFNLILHLLRASDKLSLVVAEQGMGKSALLNELAQHPAEDLRFCLIKATETMTFQQITQACIASFSQSLANQPPIEDGQQQLRQRLVQLADVHIKPVLLIDDADLLPEAVQQQIAIWLHWQRENHFLLSSVFSCTNQNAVTAFQNDRLQSLNLSPLLEDETADYLMHRLVAAGFLGEIPFTDKQLKRIYQQSKGKPSELNHAAHQVLLGSGSGQRLWPFPAMKWWPKAYRLKMSKWIAWLPVGMVILLVLFFQKHINQWFNPIDSNEPSSEWQSTSTTENIASVILDEPTLTPAEQAEREDLIALLAELEEPSEQADSRIPPMNQAIDVSINQDEHAIVDNTLEMSGVETVVADVESAVDLPDTQPRHDAKWVLSRNSQHFTYQLKGSWEAAELEAFIDEYQLSGNVAIFASMRDGQVWYALLYGNYVSRDAAIQATERWSAKLRAVPNWLRRFDTVQAQIRERPAPTS